MVCSSGSFTLDSLCAACKFLRSRTYILCVRNEFGRMCWLAGRKGWGTQSLVRDSVRSDALGLRESVHCDPCDQLSRFLGPHRSSDGDFSSDAVRPFGTTSRCVGGVIDLCSSSVRDGMGCEATSHIDVLLKLSS
jgi:hypothetical protein